MDNKLKKKEPIELYINSNGGLVTECMSLISLIEQMKEDGYTIITINAGKCDALPDFLSCWLDLLESV